MKINEIKSRIPRTSIQARFRPPKKTAILDGKPEDPKKILNMILKSLNTATGYKFVMKFKKIEDDISWVEFYYEFSEYEIDIDFQIRSFDNPSTQTWRASIDKPLLIAWISGLANMTVWASSQFKLFHFRQPITTEMINTMWDGEIKDRIHIAANPSKQINPLKDRSKDES